MTASSHLLALSVARHIGVRRRIRVKREVLQAWHEVVQGCVGDRQMYPLLCRWVVEHDRSCVVGRQAGAHLSLLTAPCLTCGWCIWCRSANTDACLGN